MISPKYDGKFSFIRNQSFRSSKKKKSEDHTCLTVQCQNIQGKLQSQLRCLDEKLECQTSMVSEIQDFFKKRADIELEYSQKLEKLAKSYAAKQKQEKPKRESWAILSTHTCWQHLIGIARKQGKDHALLSDIYGNSMHQRLSDISEDSRRLFAKSRDAALTSHEEINKVLNELQSDMKQYHVFNAQAKQAETKLKETEAMRLKVEQQASKNSKKLKSLDKQLEKRQDKFRETKLMALKARNEYLLSIDAANAATNKYFVDDLSLLIDCMDFGYHNAMQRSMLLYNSSLENVKTSHQASIDCIVKCVQELDRNTDKQNFLKCNSGTFNLPKKFEYQPHRGDEISQVSAQKPVQDDLVHRYQQLNNRLDTLKLENEETWKSVEAVDRHLMAQINIKDYDVTNLFQTEQAVNKPTMQQVEARKRRIESEKYYFEKFRSYLLDSNLIARLQAKHSTLQKALGEDMATSPGGHAARPPSLPPKPSKQRRIGKSPIVGRPKLFGCNLEEYIEATGEAIPLIIRSCVRAINLYGMHHEGVFRVSGLQAEINDIKASFEKGEDPLADVTDSTSINSIAGVLKSFFRELQEPLFPLTLFDAFVESNRLTNEQAVERIRELIHTLSPTRVIVMRYLFAFLNHLSQYSDENLMYPYNLAICFGPTLLPIPDDKDQVMYQNNVNDSIKLIIMHSDVIFPKDEPGPNYERILLDPGIAFIRQSEAKFVICLSKWSKAYRERSGSSSHQLPTYKIWLSHENIRVAANQLSDRDEADGSENEHSDDEPDVLEAVAAYDYDGRTEGELSFKQGDNLLLFHQKSAEWWEGAHQGKEGYIPDGYIHIKRDGLSAPNTPNCSGSLPNPKINDQGSPRSRLNKRRSDSQLHVQTPDSSSTTPPTELSASHPDIPSSGQPLLQLRLPPTKEMVEPQELQVPIVRTASNESLSDQSEHSRKSTPTHTVSATRPSIPRTAMRKVEKVTEFSDQVTTYTKPVSDVRAASGDNSSANSRKPSTVSQDLSSTEQMNEDIDMALAEVMSNLDALTSKAPEEELKKSEEGGKSPPPTRCTPDLVQDLPLVDNASDSSPVGSYKESRMPASPPAVSDAVNPTATSVEPQSAAETFANSDGTIVRIKSTELQRPATNVKFLTASFTRPKELSSFKRSLSTSNADGPKDDVPNVSEPTRSIGKVATVTGNAIQVSVPSIPTHLDLAGQKKKEDNSSDSDVSQSLPSTPAVQSKPSISEAMSVSSDSPLTSVSMEKLSPVAQKFKKPPPPTKAKPRPPPPPPKPKK